MIRPSIVSAAIMAASLVACAHEGHVRMRAPPQHIVDLTHTLDHNFPYIPVPGVTFPFALEPIATLEANGVAANRWTIHEHLGTQIDAPNHFAAGGRSLDQIRANEMIVPVVVIDFRTRATANRDATVSAADIVAWEAERGRIPDGACVMFNFGWSQYIGDPVRYLGVDAQHVKHFPGISPEAATFLIRERSIWGVGVDTISFDPGPDGTYQTHRVLLGADKSALLMYVARRAVPCVFLQAGEAMR
jgi:kynurenine formamidase